jgi:hypothetical protein
MGARLKELSIVIIADFLHQLEAKEAGKLKALHGKSLG